MWLQAWEKDRRLDIDSRSSRYTSDNSVYQYLPPYGELVHVLSSKESLQSLTFLVNYLKRVGMWQSAYK